MLHKSYAYLAILSTQMHMLLFGTFKNKEDQIMKKKSFYLSLLIGTSISLLGCNSGANGNPSGNNSNNSSILGQKFTTPLAANVDTNSEESQTTGLTQQNNANPNLQIVNLGGIKLNAKGDAGLGNLNDNGEEAIGWVSATNSFAPQSCWDYTVNLSGSNTNGNGSVSLTAKALAVQLGLTYSVNAGVKMLEKNNSNFSLNLLFTDATQGASLSVDSSQYVTATLTINGLNQNGLNILNRAPGDFITLCGDKVATSLPLTLGIKYIQNYSYESASINEAINYSVSNSEGEDFATTAANISQTAGISLAKGKITTSYLGNGNVSGLTTTMLQAGPYLNACTPSESSNEQQCATGISMLSTAASNAYTAAIATGINSSNWGEWFNIDYSNFNSSNFVNAAQELAITEPNTQVPDYSRYGQYESALIRSMNVLHDLVIANGDLQIIGQGINNLSPNFVNGLLDPTFSTNGNKNPNPNATLAQTYSGALIPAIQMLKEKVNNCISAESATDVDVDCSQLSQTDSVIQEFENSGYPESGVPIIYPKSTALAIEKTVQALIYSDIVSTSDIANAPTFVHNNSDSNLIPNSISSFIVFLPANLQLARQGNSPYVLVTVPTTGVPKDNNNNPVFIGAYQIASPNPNQSFWDNLSSYANTSNAAAALYSQNLSGAEGYYDGFYEVLFPSPYYRKDIPTIFDNITQTNNALCTPFGSSSQACNYTVNNYFEQAVLDPQGIDFTKPGTSLITQNITDTYNASLEPYGSDVFGTNIFETLYPWNH